MSLNPAMLAVRFLLELVAFVSFGIFGWQIADGPWRFVLVVLLPLLAAVLWGVFAVPGDRSRSGKAPVAVPGPLRLLVELAVLGGGALLLWAAGLGGWALASGLALLVYHALAYDRIAWLLGARRIPL
ncbi:hypothetical protein BJY24_007017 [Nocardia transvalensis]|uniref:DUF2568 domain-containing protein n=1 Tax=Nocardia transvalensis TaxID=37333 RepID=A0A7W9UMT3_9NOCA|nr:YrdB family protein [Nocardia transvalensis]MBB5918105.1 hypothetical protein [Nocardia transvalensis]